MARDMGTWLFILYIASVLLSFLFYNIYTIKYKI